MTNKMMILGLMALSFFSCKSDDNRDDAAVSIVGKWQVDKAIVYSGKDGSVIKDEGYDDLTDCFKRTTMAFSDKGEYSLIMYYEEEEECKKGEEMKGIYKYNEAEQLIIIDQKDEDPRPEIHKVKSLKKDELVWVDKMDDVNEDGVDDEVIFHFKKIK